MSFDAESAAPVLATADFKTLGPLAADLDKHLTLRTYLGGYTLSEADEKVWTALRTNKVAIGLVRKGAYANITRWFKFIEDAHPELKEKLNSGKEKRVGGANYNIGLQNTENGVVTRFPPEPRYVLHRNTHRVTLLTLCKWLSSHWSRKGRSP